MRCTQKSRWKKKELEWDPYACDGANREFVRLVKEEVPEFELIKQLKKRQEPISVEDLKELSIDPNSELDKPLKDIPAKYIYEDENPDLTNEGGKETGNTSAAKASI